MVPCRTQNPAERGTSPILETIANGARNVSTDIMSWQVCHTESHTNALKYPDLSTSKYGWLAKSAVVFQHNMMSANLRGSCEGGL